MATVAKVVVLLLVVRLHPMLPNDIVLYNLFVIKLKQSGLNIATGKFGAMMEVDIVNDGPVTLILERDVSQET